MRIGREIGHTIARANSESLQDRRPAIAPIEKLGVAPARLTIDHGDLFRIHFPGAASEFEWRQRRFHIWSEESKRLCLQYFNVSLCRMPDSSEHGHYARGSDRRSVSEQGRSVPLRTGLIGFRC